MPNMELILGLLAAAAALAALARRLTIPYPVVLVIGGAVLAAIPGVPSITVRPDVVFLVFLPPLLYWGAVSTSFAELRHSIGPILVLAVGLVLATVLAVAAVAHLSVGLSWPAAFVLGAILGATDPISATAIIRRLGAPQRIATVLEGEALINDGTALTAFKVALSAAAARSFSPGHGAFEFIVVSVGGMAIGTAVGAASAFVRRRLDDPNLETAIGVLTAYAAYIAADRAGASGVLASVGAGLVMSRASIEVFTPGSRLRSHAFWEVAAFILNALLFLLVGLQLRSVLHGIGGRDAGTLAWQATAVVLVLFALRLAWMFAVPTALRLRARLLGGTRRRFDSREQVVLGWSGMRGALSIAAALSVPFATFAGDRSQTRSLVVFLAFAATFVTLVLPGLTLAPLIRRLGLGESERRLRMALEARLRVARAALSRLDTIAESGDVSERTLARMRELYETRAGACEARLGEQESRGRVDALEEERRVHRALLDAQRTTLARLRAERAAPVESLHEIEHELDLEASRLGTTTV
jgi:Na+/H+ antiporter